MQLRFLTFQKHFIIIFKISQAYHKHCRYAEIYLNCSRQNLIFTTFFSPCKVPYAKHETKPNNGYTPARRRGLGSIEIP